MDGGFGFRHAWRKITVAVADGVPSKDKVKIKINIIKSKCLPVYTVLRYAL